MDNIVIKGKIEIGSTGYVGYSFLSGLVAYTKKSIALTNISVSGLQINLGNAYVVSLIVGLHYYSASLTNIIIDDYDKNYDAPNFDIVI